VTKRNGQVTGLSGRQIAALMRRHGVTIGDLSERTGITQIRIREVRRDGLLDVYAAIDWVEAITGEKIVGFVAEDTYRLWRWVRQIVNRRAGQ
jgi:hypothetical protein